jgi:hypothetical protein
MEYIISTDFRRRYKILEKAIESKESFTMIIDAFLDFYIEEIRENSSLVRLIMQETYQLMGYSKVYTLKATELILLAHINYKSI